ncbi:SDR family oxidoreductase [Shinella daejeonensis]|uniref:SDR family NAD(P)-dependent oxidoreductase n=1 Tax=Shinella daejeonensis TaxID=659017 RepID=UPI0020C81F1F|nr:SDR family NAD(P)-dependent oxidoreductase [Shinella daejeonensis]MCP8896523.1 SDR family oxidoreductase [Shinella daejeonensis]
MLLEDRTALITGAAGGIGAAIAQLFVENGARVMLADADFEQLQVVEKRLLEAGGDVHARQVDVTSERDVEDLITAVERALGRVDILVNSAGAISEAGVEAMTLDEWRRIMMCNLDAVFLTCRAVLPGMRRHGWGRIVNIASQIGQRGAPRFAHYAASKAGVIAFTKSLSREVAREGILVNAIAPGPVLTDFNKGLAPETLARTASMLPLGRSAIPSEIAGSALLLASSPHGDVFVGQTLGPNCGDVML